MMAQGEPQFRQGVPERRKFLTLRAKRPIPARGAETPSDEELLQYLEGSLEPAAKQQIRRRLTRSRYALDRLFIVRQALAECG